MTLWSGRFDTAPDPAAFDFGISFGFDRALFEDDVTGSIAWAQALAAADVLSSEDTSAIVKALREILEQGRRDPSWVAGPDEDVHSFVERQLVDRIGDAGRRLHTGRSRNEQVSLDLRLYLRREMQRAAAVALRRMSMVTMSKLGIAAGRPKVKTSCFGRSMTRYSPVRSTGHARHSYRMLKCWA